MLTLTTTLPPTTSSRSSRPATVPESLYKWASQTPHRPALIHGGESLTYAQLATEVERTAARLVTEGVARGDRVILAGHNSVNWVLVYLASLRIGALVCPANVRLNPEQFRAQCELIEAEIVVRDGALRDLTSLASTRTIDLETLVTLDAPDVGELAWPSVDDDALLSFTSGTTGLPKGAVLSQGALFMAAALLSEPLGTGANDSTLVLVPLFHNTGFSDQLNQMIVVGGATHLLESYRTADAVAELSARPVTFLTAVPSILRLLMVHNSAESVYGNARAVLFGGSPMPASWSQELTTRWPGLRLFHGYGLTEFTSGCTVLPPDLIATKGESVGTALRGVAVRIVDESGADVVPGDIGEVWVAGPTRMSRYWGQPELTAKKLVGDWLATGDVGYLDADRHLWLTGRVDDVINRGGEKVLPAYVESKICELPEVAEAVVFGFEDPVLQQRVGASLVLRAGALFDAAKASEHLLTVMPDYAVPERWVQYKEFPRTASGKPDRRVMAENFERERTNSA